MRPKRVATRDVDYASLAGMSTKSAKSKAKAKSSKSVKSEKTNKTEEEIEDIQDLTEVIFKEAEEGLGDTVMDTPLPANFEDDKVFEDVMKKHAEEEEKLKEKHLQLQRRQKALDVRKELAENRRWLEALVWSQKLQVKEMDVQEKKLGLELIEKERRLEEEELEL